MMAEPSTQNFGDYLTVKEAATFLGVSPSTLRNWDRAGKLKATRHPVNGYEDAKENDLSVAEGYRILSAYRTAEGTKFWVITEADRSATTVLLPDEY
jgi:hypothetical protein